MTDKHVVIPIFVPHKGCPFDCIYCNQKSISGQMDEMTAAGMIKIIDEHLASIQKHTHVEIGFYGGSFTGIEKDRQLEYLSLASEYVKDGRVEGIRLSTRPDYISAEILDYLKQYYVRTIELGVQSMDEEVLKHSCRGHSTEDVLKSSALIKQWGFTLGIQTMIGLPGSTREREFFTAGKVIELSPSIVRIYPTLVIKGTFLEKMYRESTYIPLTLEDAVDICSGLLELYAGAGINVIRVGLQPTENINEGSDVAAGPFHPAFRQLVESRRVLHKLEELMESLDKTEKDFIIYTGTKNVSNVVGQKRVNLDYLKNKYGLHSLKVTAIADDNPVIRIVGVSSAIAEKY